MDINQRRPMIAGNWKMYKTVSEAIELVNGLKRSLFDVNSADIVICPPFTALTEISEIIYETNICLGAQDIYWEDEGAYTGEISGAMLGEIGCKFVIIGHSERRQYFHETDETVLKKIIAALRNNLTPILCVGEDLKQREANKTFEVIEKQIHGSLKDIDETAFEKVIIAYEPIWAIGTGKVAAPEQAQEAHKFIRGLVMKRYTDELAKKIRILYGGSVKPDNIKGLMANADIDGALVGGASLKIDSFSQIVLKAN